MPITARPYDHAHDYERVNDLLVRTYGADMPHRNWLQPRWEYMHFHPLMDESSVGRIGVWEDDGRLVACVHHEHHMGHVYCQVDPAYAHLKRDMLRHAAGHLVGEDNSVQVHINDEDAEFQAIVADEGFERRDEALEHMSQLVIDESIRPPALPEGFRLQSLADENDLAKVHRALYRGFNHGDEPPDDGIEGRKKMQCAPNFDESLNIVAVAPDGSYVAYGGIWFEPVNRFAYVEPVATDPDYRRRKLGTAVVLEGVRRCGERGATVAYVGTDRPFYQSMGFRRIYTDHRWLRRL
jgi:predicted N-acetyltransferase YhbS